LFRHPSLTSAAINLPCARLLRSGRQAELVEKTGVLVFRSF
jgi:hypothetical protein